MGMRFLLAFITTFLIYAPGVQAEKLVIFDFDGTLVESREEYHGSFQTPYILYRIDNRSTTLQNAAEGPEEIEISTSDFQKFRKQFGHGPGRTGQTNYKVRLEDGREIYPGEYFLISPKSFRYFFEGPEGHNYLLENFKTAEQKGNWKGLYWPLFEQLLSDEEAAKTVGIMTARGQSKKEWKEFFDYLISKGYLKYPPQLDRVYNVSRDEFGAFNPLGSIAKRKLGLFRVIVEPLIRTRLSENDWVLSPDGDELQQLHSVVYADDDPEIIRLFFDQMQKYAQNKLLDAKFSLLNSGLDIDVANTTHPRQMTFREVGTVRLTTAEELLAEFFVRQGNCHKAVEGLQP